MYDLRVLELSINFEEDEIHTIRGAGAVFTSHIGPDVNSFGPANHYHPKRETFYKQYTLLRLFTLTDRNSIFRCVEGTTCNFNFF